jgi:hypothetical protein
LLTSNEGTEIRVSPICRGQFADSLKGSPPFLQLASLSRLLIGWPKELLLL